MPRYPLTDVEQAVKAWAKTLGIVGTRVFLGHPARASAYPYVVVLRVGGSTLGGDVPGDAPLVQLEVWGEPPGQGEAGGRDRYAVGTAAYALASEVESITPGTAMGAAAVSGGATVTRGPVWSPDPDDGQSRYIVDGQFVVLAVEPV